MTLESADCRRCAGTGWICETHPDQPWTHDGCRDVGEPCPECNPSDPPRRPPDWVSRIDE
jgi:hypothetical protein